MWRTADYAKLTFVGLLFSLLVTSTPIAAQNRQIVVNVCYDSAKAKLEIDSPKSDNLLRTSPITLRGQAELISQVEIYINGSYHKVQAIPRGGTKFSTTVNLVPGTQTIEVRGVGACNGDDIQDEVVITYQPSVAPAQPTGPSLGSKLPTVLSPTPGTGSSSGSGVVVSNPNRNGASNDNLFDWLVGLDWGSWFFRVTDVDSTIERLPTNWWRVLTFIIGLILVAGAGLLARERTDRRRNLRIVGVILILVALLIVL